MKKIIFMVGVFTFCVTISVYASNWTFFAVASASGDMCYFDSDNIQILSNGNVQIWEKEDILKSMDNIIALNEINCSDYTFRILNATTYGRYGNVIASFNGTGEWSHCVPDSIIWVLAKTVCSRWKRVVPSNSAIGNKGYDHICQPKTRSAQIKKKLAVNRVPLISQNGVYELPVKINNSITLKFIIDSGSAEVNIPIDVVMTLSRTETILKTDILPDKQYTLADGSTSIQHRILIRKLDIGGYTLYNIKASIGPALSQLLLGQSFLSRLSSWSIDNQTHAFLFSIPGSHQLTYQASSQLAPPNGTTIDNTSKNKWLVILGCDHKEERDKSEDRLTFIRPYAPTARIVDSHTYPKLLSGWWVVVEGPFSKKIAQKEKARLAPLVPDVFVRAGW